MGFGGNLLVFVLCVLCLCVNCMISFKVVCKVFFPLLDVD